MWSSSGRPRCLLSSLSRLMVSCPLLTACVPAVVSVWSTCHGVVDSPTIGNVDFAWLSHRLPAASDECRLTDRPNTSRYLGQPDERSTSRKYYQYLPRQSPRRSTVDPGRQSLPQPAVSERSLQRRLRKLQCDLSSHFIHAGELSIAAPSAKRRSKCRI